MALLELADVTMKFGELVANDRVSFTVESGSIVGLIGPNGAGKTTLFNCISGLYKPFSGRISFDGADITGQPPYRIARRGAVRTFQVVRPLKEMTVFDNVLVGAFLKCRDNRTAFDRAAECIRLCDLEPLKDKQAGDLPIGGKKRLEMARALATGPKLLMLDEVLGGLNTQEIYQAVAFIRRLRDELGLTVLWIEHVMGAIMPAAERLIVLDQGQVLMVGTPNEVVRDARVIQAYLGE